MDNVEIALWNAKLAQRGAIRKANTAMTWAGVLLRLRDDGVCDPAAVLKRWNLMCGLVKEQQIVGAKRTAVINVLALEPRVFKALLDFVNEYGFDVSPFTDAFFASQKLKPGATIRTGNKDWQSRLTISDDSLFLFVRYLKHQWSTLAPDLRKSRPKAELEDLLHLCAFCVNAMDELKSMVALPPGAVEDKLHCLLW